MEFGNVKVWCALTMPLIPFCDACVGWKAKLFLTMSICLLLSCLVHASSLVLRTRINSQSTLTYVNGNASGVKIYSTREVSHLFILHEANNLFYT